MFARLQRIIAFSLMVAVALSLLLMPGHTAAAAPTTIRFAPLPMENQETIVKQFRPMKLYLEKQLGVRVDFDFSQSYDQILKKFMAGTIDLAYLGPLPYVELRAKDPQAEPLVHFNEPSSQPMYTCALVARADAPLQLKGLRERRFALTQPLSTCGYLAVNGLLREHGSSLADNRYRYLDKHDAVALAVVRGEFDAGGVKTAIGKKYTHLGLTVLAESPPFPSFGLVANRATLPAGTMEAIRRALISLDSAGKDRDMLVSWGESIRYGAVPASDHDYDPVRTYKSNLEIPTDNKD
jgi:phosphonate transport system substrate-binding protein